MISFSLVDGETFVCKMLDCVFLCQLVSILLLSKKSLKSYVLTTIYDSLASKVL